MSGQRGGTQKPDLPDASGGYPGDEAPPGTAGTGEDVCPACSGTGKTEAGECPECGGSGKVVTGIGGG